MSNIWLLRPGTPAADQENAALLWITSFKIPFMKQRNCCSSSANYQQNTTTTWAVTGHTQSNSAPSWFTCTFRKADAEGCRTDLSHSSQYYLDEHSRHYFALLGCWSWAQNGKDVDWCKWKVNPSSETNLLYFTTEMTLVMFDELYWASLCDS